jgi:hypothetical protein
MCLMELALKDTEKKWAYGAGRRSRALRLRPLFKLVLLGLVSQGIACNPE